MADYSRLGVTVTGYFLQRMKTRWGGCNHRARNIRLNTELVKKPKDLKQHPGVVLINAVDGIGSPGAKVGTFNRVMKTRPSYVHAGFKLFFSEDVQTGKRLMTAKEVLALKPQPEYILFE